MTSTFFLTSESNALDLQMEPSKMSKLIGYAKTLAKEGMILEDKANEEEAIPKYIKVVDILLIVAESAQTHREWKDYVGKAEFYQKRAKMLLEKVSMKTNQQSQLN